MGGRPLDIDLALPADDIRKLAKQKFGDSGSKDRRNLYLVSPVTALVILNWF